MIRTIMVLLTFLTMSSAFADEQENKPPRFGSNSEIFLFDLANVADEYQLKNGVNISQNIDYDNQPFFEPNGENILFTSSRDGKQTDIYRYSITTKKLEQITHTPHSEFSPKTVGNSKNISFVSEGNNPYNSVWQLSPETGKETWLFNSKEPVGYYHFMHKTDDILFWSRYGWSVQYLNPEKNINRFVSGNALPSSPQHIPSTQNFSFVHRQTNSMVWIKSFNPTSFAITPIAPIFDDNYEYSWSSNGDIFRFSNNQLEIWPANNKSFKWTKGQNLSNEIQGKIGRLAVSPNGKYLALVVTND